jgi:hypothetical protein
VRLWSRRRKSRRRKKSWGMKWNTMVNTITVTLQADG